MSYEPIIGLETHLELSTKSKMFCRCSADHFGKKPNSQTCPVCLGLPGALPYPNQKAIEWTVLLGLALGCRIPLVAKFDRKNYFYPDLPKGYQISQYDQPFACQGKLKLKGKNSKLKVIRINRVHLEEDTGKLVHEVIEGEESSLVDFNRSGVPLVEVVSEPDIASIEELGQFTRKIRQIVRYSKISEADMEKGQMRFELNISMRKKGARGLPFYRTEVKNINSFKFLEKAAQFEIERQRKILRSGKIPLQETRGFDEKRQLTVSQRGKEEAHDYRYFPEPDIPPIRWKKSQIEALRKSLPELPDQKIEKFQTNYALTEVTSEQLLARGKKAVDYFEKIALLAKKQGISVGEIANLVINKKIDINQVSPSELVTSLADQKKKKKLTKNKIVKIMEKVLKENSEEVLRYKGGKTGLLEFFVGQVIKESRGRVDPKLARRVLIERLKKA